LEQGLRGFVLGRELDAQRKRLGMEEADAARRAKQFASEAPLRELVPIRAQAQRSQLEAVPALTKIEQGLSDFKLDEARMNIAEQRRVQEAMTEVDNLESAFIEAYNNPEFDGFETAYMQNQFENFKKGLDVERKQLEDIIEGRDKKPSQYNFRVGVNPKTGKLSNYASNTADPSEIIWGPEAGSVRGEDTFEDRERRNIADRANKLGLLTTSYEMEDDDGNITLDLAAMAEDAAKLQTLQTDRERLTKDLETLSRRADDFGFNSKRLTELDQRIQKLDESIAKIRGTPASPRSPRSPIGIESEPSPMVSDEELQNAILSLPAF
jgi:hypothetical protein